MLIIENGGRRLRQQGPFRAPKAFRSSPRVCCPYVTDRPRGDMAPRICVATPGPIQLQNEWALEGQRNNCLAFVFFC